jgi:hypothetical protein
MSAFAFDAGYLRTYPSAVPAGSFTIDAGAGLNLPHYGTMTFPPLVVSLDYALPIGGLPFSIGGIFGIYGSSASVRTETLSVDDNWLFVSFGGRFAYHFNWGIDKFDTYAFANLGWTIVSGKRKIEPPDNTIGDIEATGRLLWGISIGARYFFTRNIGPYLELGYGNLYFASLGVSFTF